MTLGAGSTSGNSYPSQTVNQLLPQPWGMVNLGVGGQSLGSMVTNAAANVDPKYNPINDYTIVIVLWGGTNDLGTGSRTPAQVFADLQTYGNARQAVGWKVVILSLLPRSATSPTFEADRQTLKGLLLGDFTVPTGFTNIWTGGSYADALVDLASDSVIGLPGSQSNLTYFNADQVHLTDAGYAIVAGYVKDAVDLVHP